MANHIAELNDLIREAYEAQEGFDNWDEGKTYYPNSFLRDARHCSLEQVVHELDFANLKLVRFVLAHPELASQLHRREAVRVEELSEEDRKAIDGGS